MAASSSGVFGECLTELFDRAGAPSLRATSQAVARSGGSVSAQRISDWRSGRHLPRTFATVEPLLVWLNTRAIARGIECAHLLSVPAWEEVWAEALAADGDTQTDAAPFAGLAPCDPSRRDLFFGRDALIDDLAREIDRARDDDGPALVVVTGVSGAGKSSLLGAGVARGDRFPPVARASISAGGLSPSDVGASGSDMVVIDQFESLFALPGPVRATVIAELERLATDRPVVIGVRSDFFDRCVRVPVLARAWRTHCVIVGPMTDDELSDAIAGPVRAVGGRIESGLVEMLIADVHTAADREVVRCGSDCDSAGRLPLLAHVLASTWDQRTQNRMTIAAYRSTGGVTRALSATAENAWAEVVDAGLEDLARSVLIALTALGPNGIGLRSALSHDDLTTRFPPEAGAVVEIFVRARLLTSTATTLTLVHDVVLSAWPRLAGWLAEDRAAHVSRQQLEDDTRAWRDNSGDHAFLYRGSRLDEALRDSASYSARYRHLLSQDNFSFLAASVRARRRRAAVTVGAATVVVLLAIVSTVAAGVGLRQAADLRDQRDVARRTALLSHIDNLARSDPSTADRLRLVAHDAWPDDTALTGALLGAVNRPLARSVAGHTGPVYDLAVRRDGSMLASSSADRTVRLWHRDPDGHLRGVSTVSGFGDFVTSVAFHPDAPVIAAGAGDGTVRVFDISVPGRPRPTAVLHPGRGAVYDVAFSDDGTRLVAASDDSTITVFSTVDAVRPQPVSVLRGHTGPVRTLAFAPGGAVLASGGDDATVRLWDATDPRAVRPTGGPVTGFASVTHAVSFAPDGRTLVVTGNTPDAQVIDVSDPLRPRRVATALPGTTAGSWSATTSPDGSLLASASEDGIVKVWNMVDPRAPRLLWSLERAPEPDALTVSTVAFDAGGTHLVVGQSDGTLADWSLPATVIGADVGTASGMASSGDHSLLAVVGTTATLALFGGQPMRRLSGVPITRVVDDHPSVAMSYDGTQVATANNNGGSVQLFDSSDPAHPVVAGAIATGTRYTHALAYAPGRRLLAAGLTDRSIALWDTTDPAATRRVSAAIDGPGDTVNTVAISDDGRLLAIASDDHTTRVVDISDPTRPRETAVLPDTSPVLGAVFSADGHTLFTAARAVSAWNVSDPGRPTRIGAVDGVYATTIATIPGGVIVGTAGRALRRFVRTPGGGLTPAPAPAGDPSAGSTWFLPTRISSVDDVVTSGGTDATLRVRSLDPDSARRWICAATDALPPAVRRLPLPGRGDGGECD